MTDGITPRVLLLTIKTQCKTMNSSFKQIQREMLIMMFIDSIQRNSRKQVSNGYDDTSTGDEQIRPVVFYSSRRSWMETTAGNPGLVLEDGRMMRRTEDEDNTLGMTQKVSNFNNRAKSMGRTE